MKLHACNSRFLREIVFCILTGILLVSEVNGQYFGQVKPRYRKEEARVLLTPNFELYHFLNEPEKAQRLGRWHEWWYRKHQMVLEDTFNVRNPIIFYNHHADFQQTTAIESIVGVGTSGVTESLKNRVVMPFLETNSQTSHVIGHEMVHAFQFKMLMESDSLSIGNVRNIPLWMTEGMAEYLSLGKNHPQTAMWMRDALIHDDFPTLKNMTENFNYFPYRYGHAFWAFVCGIWGEEIIKPLYLATAQWGYPTALKEVLGISENDFSRMWKDHYLNYYSGFLADTTEKTGVKLFHRENAGLINLSPVYSPDAKYMAFISEKDVLSMDIYLVDVKSRKILRKLSNPVQKFHVDDFNYVESVGTFSPDNSQFAYTVISKGKNMLMIVEVESGKALKEIEIPGLENFNYPNWSPNGRYIALSGMVEGQSDLYLYDLRTLEIIQLTDDLYANIHPSWSPDGEYIVFASDRGKADLDNFRFEGFEICILELRTKEIRRLNLFPGAENLNPHFSVDGNIIYFLSDADGFRDLYEYSLVSGDLYRLTGLFTGISGITHLSPALTVARNNGLIAYSVFEKGEYNIYLATPEDFFVISRPSDATKINQGAAILPPVHSLPVYRAQQARDSLFRSRMAWEDSLFRPEKYRPKFQLDYLGNTGSLLVAGGYATGLAGGVNAVFSDILGNRQLFSALSLNGEIFDVGAQLAYINRKRPVQWGALISHIPYQSASVSLFPDSLELNERRFSVWNYAVDFLRTFETRTGLFALRPISQAHRVEIGLANTFYNFRVDRQNNYYYQGNFVGSNKERQEAPNGYSIQQVNLAYIGDNTVFGTVGPLRGKRYRFDLERYFGLANLYTTLADYRQYARFRPLTLAFRAMHIGRYGPELETNNIFPPLYIGQPTLIRGFVGQNFNPEFNLSGSFFSPNQLAGNKMMVGNLEARLPFSGPERISVIKSGLFPTELAAFMDAGIAWDTRGYPFLSPTEDGRFRRKRPVFSTGLSCRLNLLGYLVVEPYFARPLIRGIRGGVFGLNFTPAW